MESEKYIKSYFKRKGTVAKWWNPTEGDYAHIYEKQLELIINWIKEAKPKRGLEVSCGKGRATNSLSKLFKKYLATDISKEMITIAKKRCRGITFKQEDAENLSISSETQDCVICLEALVHYPNPQKAINEFYRVLKPEGILILDSDNLYSLRRIIKKIFKLFYKQSNKPIGEDIFQTYTKQEIYTMLKISGFRLERLVYLGTLGPIRIRKSAGNFYIISPRASRLLSYFSIDKIPVINKLATYHLILARK